MRVRGVTPSGAVRKTLKSSLKVRVGWSAIRVRNVLRARRRVSMKLSLKRSTMPFTTNFSGSGCGKQTCVSAAPAQRRGRGEPPHVPCYRPREHACTSREDTLQVHTLSPNTTKRPRETVRTAKGARPVGLSGEHLTWELGGQGSVPHLGTGPGSGWGMQDAAGP